MSAPAVFAVVVVYNRSCADSSACRDLLAVKAPVTPIVFDNGDRDYGNRQWCEKNNWIFLGGKGNLGLSKAYNESVAACLTSDPDGTVCFLDDDAKISSAYFSELERVIQSDKEADVFVPIQTGGGGLLSPCVMQNNGRCRLFRTKEEMLGYRGVSLTAVNSKMAARLRVFRDFRYDERLFLDFVDHSFFREMNRRGARIRIFEGGGGHSISSHEHPPKESAARRFAIFVRDARVFWEHRPWIGMRILLRRTIRLTVEYKSPAFVRTLLFAHRTDRRASGASKGDTA